MRTLEALLKQKILDCEKAGDMAQALIFVREWMRERSANDNRLRQHPIVLMAQRELDAAAPKQLEAAIATWRKAVEVAEADEKFWLDTNVDNTPQSIQ